MQLQSLDHLGHDFLVPDAFEAPILPEWRLAVFSIVLPIPRAAALAADAPFDFAQAAPTSPAGRDGIGWRYGRDKGVRTIENPQWDAARQVFRAPTTRYGYYGEPIVEGGRPFYNDARSRFVDPLDKATGAASVDVDVERRSPHSPDAPGASGQSAAEREVLRHEDAQRRAEGHQERDARQAAPGRETTLADAGWNPEIGAHHFLFAPRRNETEFELVNYDEQLPWEDQRRGERGSHGTATLRLLSAEVVQFHDLKLTNLSAAVPEPSHTTSDFLVLNVSAENVSSATLAFLSATLNRPRNSSQFYEEDRHYHESPPQLHALTKFTNLAVAQIDRALGRERSMRLTTGGALEATAAAPGEAGTFTLPAPQRVAFAVPNPARPGMDAAPEGTLGEGNNGSVPERIDPPLALAGTPERSWEWHEQWAWQILTGADSYPESVPAQTPEALRGFLAAKLSSWTIFTSDSGVGMVRTKSASREGMRYWSMAGTRFVDLVMLQMRAQAGEAHLRKSLQIVGEKSTAAHGAAERKTHQRELQADLKRLEKLQLDHIEIRDKLWFRSVPGRDIDTRVLKGLQQATDFNQLRDDFDSKVHSRQNVIRTQFEQLSGAIADEESKRAEAMNLVLGFVAAAIGAPDWADVVGVTSLPGMLGLAAVIFVLMFAVVWVVQGLFALGRHRRR
ncbi:hypothetical protein [Corynebacterium bouchesdurhonense]|uniref:hypothetical protein n=1 Tax=Corynebacterium bouchesdurhonense TaxID=1720192 RepID=UPI00082B1C41|nr:hypothetical protein [Corynebacterium bouchesdurhonense]